MRTGPNPFRTPPRSEFFIEVDGENEPTLWLENGEQPRALLRRSEIPASSRSLVWTLIRETIACHQCAPVCGQCLHCGAVEVELTPATGTRDLSSIGESASYPTGHGCEVCG